MLGVSLLLGIAHTAKAQISDAGTSEFRRIEQPLGVKAGIVAAGAGLIGLELWWFLFSKTKVQTAQVDEGVQTVEVAVDGGYSPNQIVVQAGQPVKLTFLRKDRSSCLEQVIFPDFNRSVDLPLNQKRTVEVTPKEAGSYPFHCGMNMFRGTLTVEDSSKPEAS